MLIAEAPKHVPWGEQAIRKYGSADAASLAFERV